MYIHTSTWVRNNLTCPDVSYKRSIDQSRIDDAAEFLVPVHEIALGRDDVTDDEGEGVAGFDAAAQPTANGSAANQGNREDLQDLVKKNYTCVHAHIYPYVEGVNETW